MIGKGTLVNMAAVIVGGGIGLLLKGGMKERFQVILMQALGISSMFIGVCGALQGLLVIENGQIKTAGTMLIMLMILSMVFGSLLGEAVDIEGKLEKFGERLKNLIKTKGDNSFVEGFVNASLVECVGAMAVLGSIRDGLTGDASVLYTKAVLDGVVIIIFASAMGAGTLFSVIPLGIYQGSITLFAKAIEPYLEGSNLIGNLSFIGSVLIFGVGVNLAFGKKFKVGNMLPALLVPVIYEIIIRLI